MVYRLNETTWLQDAGGGAEILNILNWAMLTIDDHFSHRDAVHSLHISPFTLFLPHCLSEHCGGSQMYFLFKRVPTMKPWFC